MDSGAAPATVAARGARPGRRSRLAALAAVVVLAAACNGDPAADTATATSAVTVDATSSPAADESPVDGSPGASPAVGDPTDVAFEPGTASLDVGGQRYDLTLDKCFASPQDGVEVTGTSAAGERMTADFQFDSPEQADVYLTSSDGEALWTSNDPATPPEFQLESDGRGFSVRGTFVNPDGTEIDGSLSGSC